MKLVLLTNIPNNSPWFLDLLQDCFALPVSILSTEAKQVIRVNPKLHLTQYPRNFDS